MKAMLLSAGLGRRMLPLTLCVPKPAIPVLGRPMAMEILGRMARYDVEEVVLNLHHLADFFLEAHLSQQLFTLFIASGFDFQFGDYSILPHCPAASIGIGSEGNTMKTQV